MWCGLLATALLGAVVRCQEARAVQVNAEGDILGSGADSVGTVGSESKKKKKSKKAKKQNKKDKKKKIPEVEYKNNKAYPFSILKLIHKLRERERET